MTEKQSVEIATVEHIESLVFTIRGQQVMLLHGEENHK